MQPKLRFAPIIRVSTEKQEVKGESLRTQEQQIISTVEGLGGVIPDYCWRYTGQEHATPGMERNKMEALLRDSEKGIFDAIIVSDLSRWSRDNRKSKDGLDVLKKNKIKFYVLGKEYDLFDPQDCFTVGMTTEMNEMAASSLSQKSLINRISRAKRGMPAVGRRPYGRTYTEADGWGINQKKKRNIEKAAKMYLEGMPMPDIAKIFKMNHSALHKTLTKRSGPTWKQRFKSEKFNIDQTIITEVPHLLPDEVIKKINERCIANKTFTHGAIKHKYLLARMIFCSHCGYAMFGQTNHSGKRYYRHARQRKLDCKHKGYVPANDIEDAVMVHLFAAFGDPKGVERAVKNALPKKKDYEELLTSKKEFDKDIRTIEKAKGRLLDMVEKGSFDEEDIIKRMKDHKEREAMIKNELFKLDQKLEGQISPQQLKNLGKNVSRIFLSKGVMKQTIASHHSCCDRLYEMSYEEKRQLLQYFFAGKDEDRKRFGVYVTRKSKGKYLFDIKGALGEIGDALPMKQQDARDLLGVENENMNPFTGAVQGMRSKRDAYYSIGLY